MAALVFGSDAGLVSERAKLIARSFARREQPAGEIIRIEDIDLEADSSRLLVELQTVQMFGGAKVVRTALGRRVTGALLKQILEPGPPMAQLVVEAGNLKPTDAARKIFDAAAWAATIPCYGDSQKDLSGIAAEMMTAAGKLLLPDARELLLSRLGADRALSRGEIDKLVVFAGERTEITAKDVDAVVGDASELAMDQIASAVASGLSDAALRDFDRATAAGDNPQTLLLALQRYFLRLHKLRAAIDGGKSLSDVIRSARPPIHFKEKDTVSSQCQAWGLDQLMLANVRIADTIKSARQASVMETAFAERLLLDLSLMARRTRRG